MQKEITVVVYGYQLTGGEWSPNINLEALDAFMQDLHGELITLGITVLYLKELDNVLDVKGYGDLLNTIRLRSPKDHISNLCLGHIIGQSANCDYDTDSCQPPDYAEDRPSPSVLHQHQSEGGISPGNQKVDARVIDDAQ